MNIAPAPVNIPWRLWTAQPPLPPRFGNPQHMDNTEPCPFDTLTFVEHHFPNVTLSTRRGLSLPIRKVEVHYQIASNSITPTNPLAHITYDGHMRPLAFFLHLFNPLGVGLRFESELLIAESVLVNNTRFRERFDPAHENLRIMAQIQDSFGEWRTIHHFSSYTPTDEEYPIHLRQTSHNLVVQVEIQALPFKTNAMDFYTHFGATLINLPLTAHPLQLAILKGECHYFDRTYFLRELAKRPSGDPIVTPLEEYNPGHLGMPRRRDIDGLPVFTSLLSDHLLYEPRYPSNPRSDRDITSAPLEERYRDIVFRPPIAVIHGRTDFDRLNRTKSNYNRASQSTRNTSTLRERDDESL